MGSFRYFLYWPLLFDMIVFIVVVVVVVVVFKLNQKSFIKTTPKNNPCSLSSQQLHVITTVNHMYYQYTGSAGFLCHLDSFWSYLALNLKKNLK